jgi:hypothetical protein
MVMTAGVWRWPEKRGKRFVDPRVLYVHRWHNPAALVPEQHLSRVLLS